MHMYLRCIQLVHIMVAACRSLGRLGLIFVEMTTKLINLEGNTQVFCEGTTEEHQ
jgi:hypothetical protein